METSVVASVVSGAFAIGVAVFEYFGNKRKKDEDEETRAERQQLSQDETEFRKSILEENKALRTRLEEYEHINIALQKQVLHLQGILIKAGLVPDGDEYGTSVLSNADASTGAAGPESAG